MTLEEIEERGKVKMTPEAIQNLINQIVAWRCNEVQLGDLWEDLSKAEIALESLKRGKLIRMQIERKNHEEQKVK